MALQQRFREKACDVFCFADVNSNVQGLIQEHGDRFEVSMLYGSLRHSASLLPWRQTTHRTEQSSWVDRSESVEVSLPSTAEGFLVVPTDISGVLSTSPTESQGICSHYVKRGLRTLSWESGSQATHPVQYYTNFCSKSRCRQSMSSLFGTNLEQEKKSEDKRGGGMTSTRREPRYQATHTGLAATLSETSARWHGLFWACQGESQKQAGCLADVERDGHDLAALSYFACMLPLRLRKGGRLIALVMDPHGKDDPDPHIGQRTDGHRMTFAFRSLALVIVSGPCFTLGGLPGKLVQSIAQRF